MNHPIGMISGESSEVYHSSPDLSHSKLEDFRFRPAYYYGRHVTKEFPREATKSLIYGAALHSFYLEGDDAFRKQFVVLPKDAPRRPSERQRSAAKPSQETRDAIAWWDAFNAQLGGREIVDAETFAVMPRIASAILANRFAADLLTSPGVSNELTFRTPPLAGLPIGAQCKADAYNAIGCERSAGVPYVADLKSTDDLNNWLNSYHKYGYYRQGPFYRRVIETVSRMLGSEPSCKPAERFFFVAFEKEPPYGCTVFEADGVSLASGLREVEESLEQMKICYATNYWPAAQESAAATMPVWWRQKGAA